MASLLHKFFCNSLDPKSFNEKSNEISEINYYKNNELVFACFYDQSKLVKKLNFEREERHKFILEYYDNYHIKTVYSLSGEISSKHIVINDVFSKNDSSIYLIQSKNDWKVRFLEDGIQEINISKKDSNIIYWFKNKLLIKLIFDNVDCEHSYVIDAKYDNLGRIIEMNKKFSNNRSNHCNKIKWVEYEDNLIIEKEYHEGKYSFKLTKYDDKSRPLKVISFVNNEDKLDIVKNYIKKSNEETLRLIIKFIYLEIFEYDQFDNQVLYKEMYYRPDFSKERLTPYIEEYEYYDKYNINFGSYYCKTKTDYDDYTEYHSQLEYLNNKVNQYQDGELIGIHYIENEKKIKSEFFIREYDFEKMKQNEYSEEIIHDLYIIEKYDQFGNAIESYVENKTEYTKDTYRIETIFI